MRLQRHTMIILLMTSLFSGLLQNGNAQHLDNLKLNAFIENTDELITKRDFEAASALSNEIRTEGFNIDEKITFYLQKMILLCITHKNPLINAVIGTMKFRTA